MNARQVWLAPFQLWNDLYVGVADIPRWSGNGSYSLVPRRNLTVFCRPIALLFLLRQIISTCLMLRKRATQPGTDASSPPLALAARSRRLRAHMLSASTPAENAIAV